MSVSQRVPLMRGVPEQVGGADTPPGQRYSGGSTLRSQGSDGSIRSISPMRERDSKTRLSRPSSREQILNEFSRGALGKPDSFSSTFQVKSNAPHAASTTVNFQVSVATNLGERVVAVGNCTPLGMWEPRNALELHTTPAVFPLWQVRTLKSHSLK